MIAELIGIVMSIILMWIGFIILFMLIAWLSTWPWLLIFQILAAIMFIWLLVRLSVSIKRKRQYKKTQKIEKAEQLYLDFAKPPQPVAYHQPNEQNQPAADCHEHMQSKINLWDEKLQDFNERLGLPRKLTKVQSAIGIVFILSLFGMDFLLENHLDHWSGQAALLVLIFILIPLTVVTILVLLWRIMKLIFKA